MTKRATTWMVSLTLGLAVTLTSGCARDCEPFVASQCAAAGADAPACQRLRQVALQVPLQTCEAVRNALDSKSRVR